MVEIISDLNLLHPKFRGVAYRLRDILTSDHQAGITKTRFEVFETFRSPQRQADLLAKKTTKAGPFESAHQFGLAIDFVPYITGDEANALAESIGEGVFPGWNWHSSHDWEHLRKVAKRLSLVTIDWDKPHVQHPDFGKILYNFRNLSRP